MTVPLRHRQNTDTFAAGPPFVGRGPELALAHRLLDEAASGRGSVLFLTGAEGVGKTRLLAALATAFENLATVLQTQCLHGAGDIAAAAQLQARFPAFDVLSIKSKPTVLLIDDLQLAANADVEFVHALVDNAPRSRVLCVATVLQRCGDSGAIAVPLHAWLSKGARSHVVGPLDDGDVQALVRMLAAPRQVSIDASAMREIIATSEGNPRFAHELVDQAASSGPKALVPASARAFVSTLRARVSKSAFDVLAVAAIVGDRFNDRWIAQLTGAPQRTIADALQAGCDQGFIRECAERPGSFSFRQTAHRRALSETLISSKRSLLHAQIAELLTEMPVEAPFEPIVAEHLAACGRTSEAREWFARAGGRLIESGDFSGGAHLYERAARSSRQGSAEWMDLQRNSAFWYSRIGARDRSALLHEEMVRFLAEENDPATLAKTLSALFYDYIDSERWDDAEETLARMRELPLPPSNDERVRAENAWAIFLTEAGNYREANRVFSAIDKTALSSEAGMLEGMMSSAYVGARERPLEETLKILDNATEASARIPAGKLIAQTLACEVAGRLGNLRVARQRADDAALLAEDVRERPELALQLKLDRAEFCVLGGDLDVVPDMIRSIVRTPHLGRRYELQATGIGLFVGMRIGDWSLIQALLDPVIFRRLDGVRDAATYGTVLRGVCDVMSARGSLEHAIALVHRAVEAELSDAYLWIPLTAAQIADDEHAAMAREHIVHRDGKADGPVVSAALAMFDAYLHARNGKRMASKQAGRNAAALYRRLEWPLFEARAFEIAGDYSAAQALYARYGATADVARLGAKQTRKGRRAPFAAPLTRREREIAELVAGGRSDRDISTQLNISERTVHHHVAAILGKLGLRSRWQIRLDAGGVP
jgi:DNA-binding CsgD family transcriptional regulator